MKLAPFVVVLGLILVAFGAVAAVAVPATANYNPQRAPLLSGQAITAPAPWRSQQSTVLDDQVVTVGIFTNTNPAVTSALHLQGSVKSDIVSIAGHAHEVNGGTFDLSIYDLGNYTLFHNDYPASPLYSAKGITDRDFAFATTLAQASQPLYFWVGAEGFLGSAMVRLSATASWDGAMIPTPYGHAVLTIPTIPGPSKGFALRGEVQSTQGQAFDLMILDDGNYSRFTQGTDYSTLYRATATTDTTFTVALPGAQGGDVYHLVVRALLAVDEGVALQASTTLEYQERPAYFTTISGGRYLTVGGGVLSVGGLVGVILSRGGVKPSGRKGAN